MHGQVAWWEAARQMRGTLQALWHVVWVRNEQQHGLLQAWRGSSMGCCNLDEVAA
jgi:hypothetical protein